MLLENQGIMILSRLIYSRRPTSWLKTEDVQAILKSARERNAVLGVTGALFFRHDLFIQVLEGSRRNLSSLLEMILDDDRHSDLMLHDFREIGERQYSEWSMGYVSLTKASKTRVMRFSPDTQFDPSHLRTEQLVEVLFDLASCADGEQESTAAA